jgi:SAM-dependent methyltransferase
MLRTPVAFLIFNRPDLAERVFAEVARVKPRKLLVVADGPRFPEEADKCERTRAIIKRVDWDCEVLTDFSELNLGCKRRISTGLDWVFSKVEEAIILEDDCLPAPSFFGFCEELLEKYRDDERVMHISGDNFQNGQSRTEYSYYFSRYSHVWGWASWRRAWQHYDVGLKTWPRYKQLISSLFNDPYEQAYWQDTFSRVYEGAIDTWDYQWLYACLTQSGLAILPNSNLVSNIGFGEDATHTREAVAPSAIADIWEIKHPPIVIRHAEADQYTFDDHLGGRQIKKQNPQKHELDTRAGLHEILADGDPGPAMGEYTYEESVQWMRRQPEYEELVRHCYLDRDNFVAAERFALSEEFVAVSTLLGLSKTKRSLNILDLGCGNGIASYAFAALGHNVSAIDPDSSEDVGIGAAARLARRVSQGTIATSRSFAESLPFADDSFDIVYARQSLHHFSELSRGVAECARVLKPGGTFFATREHVVSDEEQLKTFLAEHLLQKFHGGEHAYLLNDYLSVLEQAGLKLVRCFAPYDSVINHFPESNTELRFRFYHASLRKYGRWITPILWRLPIAERKFRRRLSAAYDVPGRMYSFLCVKSRGD